jgi:tetratricopeptide (TPR) repeat protein
LSGRPGLRAAWGLALAGAAGVRLWNACVGPRMWGYDAWGHVAYALYLDLHAALPWADQGWSYYHPPLHYAVGWALAQFGSGDVLVRGLALFGSGMSLGCAGLAAWVARLVHPERPWLALLAFGAVAFLPVQLVVSTMPGNEMTQAFLSSAAVAVFIRNECRRRPSLGGDVGVGVLLGLALLTKSNALVVLVALCAAHLLLLALEGTEPGGRRLPRLVLVAGLALLLAAPLYLRNARAFGTPLPSNSDFALLQSVEGRQLPGYRTWRDYLSVPGDLFGEPDPRARALLHSVWGSLYLNAWSDSQRESDVAPTPASRQHELRVRRWLALLGLPPTLLALVGGALAGRDVWRGRRRGAYVPLLALTAAGLLALARFSWGMPTWAALKASYLLPVSLAFALFLARGVEGLAERSRGAAVAGGALLALTASAAVAAVAAGALLPRRADAPAMGAVHFYFGEYDEARRIYQRLAAGAPDALPWIENLAAVELADGRAEEARQLCARALRLAGDGDARRIGRLAVASALAGDRQTALDLLERAVEDDPSPDLLANRGALRAALGDADGARGDLRAALEVSPGLVPAAWNLAQQGEEEAAALGCAAPRGYPWGLGTGEIVEWGVGRRPLLVLEDGALDLARPDFYRRACRRLRELSD